MHLSFKGSIGLICTILIFAFLFCEYLIYYIVLSQCSWPHLNADTEDQILKVALIADTHLLGIRKGHWFDKLRREWQMYRSFQTLVELHEPELIFILGDVFDEASFSPDDVYLSYVKRFQEMFNISKEREMYVVAGNHDVGFHYAMHPYLEHRFSQTMNVSFLISKKDIHFVLLNSMALEKDSCNICKNTERQIQIVSDIFRCSNGTMKCSQNKKLKRYSRPIMLMHFPLFRKNDGNCQGWNIAPSHEREMKFKEKWDCLSREATDYVLKKLHPRVVFTGHTHHSCETLHKPDIMEYTIPSFNWRNKPSPGFILAVFTPQNYAVQSCILPHEYYVIMLYIITVIFSLVMLYKSRKKKKIQQYSALKNE